MTFASALFTSVCVLSNAFAVDEIGGTPTPVGAGPRSLGMGGAFTAIADDASANTWNPGGMIQLERPEAGCSFAYRSDHVRLSDGGTDSATMYNLDHLSLVLPFALDGVQQTFGLAWQRQLDFTRSLSGRDSEHVENPPFSIDTVGAFDIDQEGGFSSVSASYASEIVPGLGIGLTAHAWGDDWTLDSRYHQQQRLDNHATFFLAGPPPAIETLDQVRVDSTITVKEGYSFVAGAWWQATPSLTIGATVKPKHRLRLTTESTSRSVTTDLLSGAQTGDVTTRSATSSDLIYPASATIGAAWRQDDVHTVALDVGWTHWRQYRRTENHITQSPINVNIEPERFHDSYSVRLGYEHLSILPRAVVVQRVGGFYEGLPASTEAPDPTQVDRVHPTTDTFYGITAGLSVCLRTFLYDLSAQARYGHDVGAGQYAAPDKTADVLTFTVRGGVTCQF